MSRHPQVASTTATGELRAIPVRGIRDVFAGDSVADLVVDALALGGLRLHEGDILVLKHKIVSKAEDRRVALDSVSPPLPPGSSPPRMALMRAWWNWRCAKPSAWSARNMF